MDGAVAMSDEFHNKNVGTVAGLIGLAVFLIGIAGFSLYLS